MRALSIRQPFAELILRGLKTIEYRSRRTNIIGERFWIYASKGKAARAEGGNGTRLPSARPVLSDNLQVETPPPWMIELANALRLFSHELPTGLIVGSAVIERCEPHGALASDVNSHPDFYEWHLTNVKRLAQPRKPAGHPQPVWFNPDPQS